MSRRGEREPAGARHRALLALAAGVAVLVAAGVVAGQNGSDVGADRVRELAEPTSAAGSPAAGTTSPVPVVAGALPTGSGALRPTRLRIPALDLTASVDAVGIDAGTGDFAVPPSVDRVGWYRYGPGLEATAGSIVIAGHVDSARQGEGAFFRLRTLSPGDEVTLTGADGRGRRFTVVAREEYRKTRIPLERYFARDGRLRLTLITCGGPFDRATGRYRDNIVVTAEPAS